MEGGEKKWKEEENAEEEKKKRKINKRQLGQNTKRMA